MCYIDVNEARNFFKVNVYIVGTKGNYINKSVKSGGKLIFEDKKKRKKSCQYTYEAFQD